MKVVTPKEVTGNDNAVIAVTSKPTDVVRRGAVRVHPARINRAVSISQGVGFGLGYNSLNRAPQRFPDRYLSADAPFDLHLDFRFSQHGLEGNQIPRNETNQKQP